MQSPDHFLYGYFSMDMKLPKGNSGGVNFAWYALGSAPQPQKSSG